MGGSSARSCYLEMKMHPVGIETFGLFCLSRSAFFLSRSASEQRVLGGSVSTTMLRPLHRSLPQCLRQRIPTERPLAGPCLLQKRHKHGRDFPRNIPPPPPPFGTKLFSNPTMTLYHSPAPSPASYKSTPLSFLPEAAPFNAANASSMVPLRTQLPPPLTTRRPRQKKMHLMEEDIEKIRELRSHPDPAKRKSRRELARMFGCGNIFVGMVAPVSKEVVREKELVREEQVQSWGERKRFLREARKKRKEGYFTASEGYD
jgi:hypothetical protein